VWEEASAAHIIEAFAEALGPGEPSGLADMHLAALQQAQLAAISSAAGASLLRAPTPLGSGAVTPPPLLAGSSLGAAGGGVSLQASLQSSMAGLAGNSQLAGYPGSGGSWGAGGSAAAAATMAATVAGLGMLSDGDPAAAAAAAVAAAGSAGPMSVSGTTASPVMGDGLPRGVSGGYDSNAESAPAGFMRMGACRQHCYLRFVF
jgi:hypothetical protein